MLLVNRCNPVNDLRNFINSNAKIFDHFIEKVGDFQPGVIIQTLNTTYLLNGSFLTEDWYPPVLYYLQS